MSYFTKQIRIVVKNRKLIVKDAILTHEKHNTDKATFDNYPENMHISADKIKDVEKMISLGVNKQKLKADLMADGVTNVALKALHNLQTKIRKQKEGSSDEDYLQKLLDRLNEIPNAKIRIVTCQDNELIGKYKSVF